MNKKKLNNLLEEFKNKNYNISIDNNNYSIPILELINIIIMPYKEFEKICNDNKIEYICNIKKEHFIYATYNFLKEYNIIDKYNLKEDMINIYKGIESQQIIDTQALNKHLKTIDSKYQSVKLNKELKEKILEKMPQNLSKLEKAIYIYIKMCRILTYDEEYYVTGQKGNTSKNHKDINYIPFITPKNNKIVCYEFNLIYSKLLSELGINFKSNYSGLNDENYGLGHANIEFRINKYIISADAVVSIIRGDMSRAKLNQPLGGLECDNINTKTRQEFNTYLSKISKLIEKEEYNKQINYIKFDTDSNINLEQKLLILMNGINSSNLEGIDLISYALTLNNTLFTPFERRNNIKITIIKNNEPLNRNKPAKAGLVFTVNKNNYKTSLEENIYYFIDPKKNFIILDKVELQKLFDNKTLEYIENNNINKKIPGINETTSNIKR